MNRYSTWRPEKNFIVFIINASFVLKTETETVTFQGTEIFFQILIVTFNCQMIVLFGCVEPLLYVLQMIQHKITFGFHVCHLMTV